MTSGEQALQAINAWQAKYPTLGQIGRALGVLERLKATYDLNLDAHLTQGKGQVASPRGTSIQSILARYGETRDFPSEAGRTSRKTISGVGELLQALAPAQLDILSIAERNEILSLLQQYLTAKVTEAFNRERIKFRYEPGKTARQLVTNLLAQAKDRKQDGPVAQYLVGAKLELRYADSAAPVQVRNESYSTADVQLGRTGDFELGDTAFHVTVAPGQLIIDKCGRNLREGIRPFLLVPNSRLSAAQQLAELAGDGLIAVESIESFVSQNVEELSLFSQDKLAVTFLRLLQMYNRRVDAVERDKSLLIEIPQNLARLMPAPLVVEDIEEGVEDEEVG